MSSKEYINFITLKEEISVNFEKSTSFISGTYPAFSSKLLVLTYIYCIYGPVSPLKLSIASQSNISSLILLLYKSLNITAPTPIFLAISSLFSRFGFFSSIICVTLLIASFSKSSNFITFPSLVDILPVFNCTIPKGTCTSPFVYFSSKFKCLATSNICLKCNICSYEVTYIALSKSYVLAL